MNIQDLTDFELAEQLSAAATFLDDVKPAHVGHEHVEGLRHVEFLNDLAQHLSGDRVLELYPED
jgi:hypothetical protein